MSFSHSFPITAFVCCARLLLLCQTVSHFNSCNPVSISHSEPYVLSALQDLSNAMCWMNTAWWGALLWNQAKHKGWQPSWSQSSLCHNETERNTTEWCWGGGGNSFNVKFCAQNEILSVIIIKQQPKKQLLFCCKFWTKVSVVSTGCTNTLHNIIQM